MKENWKDTSWTDTIDGEQVTVTIEDVIALLDDHRGQFKADQKIKVADIAHLDIHKDKNDSETTHRAERTDLTCPIIICKNVDGKYNRVLDGNHRLHKAVLNDIQYIDAKVLDFSLWSSNFGPIWRQMFC
jgi:hypothetical protein